jgi:N6-adenosine-specific RNA methylase IME4
MVMYSIVYADPAWNYTSFSNKIPSRSKEGQPYNAMRMVDIYDFELPPLNDDCVLFLWATSALLPEALHTIKCWGFEFKTVAFTWIKKNKKETTTNFWGMGSWTRSNPEYCLLATRGNPKAVSHSVHSVIETPIEEHSKKPDCVRDKIVELCGDIPRIELFARQSAIGWDAQGNQLKPASSQPSQPES